MSIPSIHNNVSHSILYFHLPPSQINSKHLAELFGCNDWVYSQQVRSIISISLSRLGSRFCFVRRKNYPAHYELQASKCCHQRSDVENFVFLLYFLNETKEFKNEPCQRHIFRLKSYSHFENHLVSHFKFLSTFLVMVQPNIELSLTWRQPKLPKIVPEGAHLIAIEEGVNPELKITI